MHGTLSTSIRHPRTLTCVPRIACIPPASLDHDCFTLVPRDQTQAVDLRANSNGQRSEWVRALMRLCGVRVLEQRTADGKSTEEAVLSARQSMASSIGGGSSVHEFTDADACVQWMNQRALRPLPMPRGCCCGSPPPVCGSAVGVVHAQVWRRRAPRPQRRRSAAAVIEERPGACGAHRAGTARCTGGTGTTGRGAGGVGA